MIDRFNPLYRSANPHQYVAEVQPSSRLHGANSMQVMLPQLYDLVQSYSPDIIWADGEWEQSSAYESRHAHCGAATQLTSLA